ncbi:MAG: murein biosynthesis integral membrane protein MurJ, partial [Ktedonobacteraceae bacterium]
MGNDGQHRPLSQQGVPEQQQQSYFGWQYEQDQHVPTPPAPAQAESPEQEVPPVAPVPPQFRSLRSYSPPSGPLEQPLSPQYQEPLLDMGSSLGYGQGMEYQYFNAPQPSQPMPALQQNRPMFPQPSQAPLDRLQQLREERLRRQRGGPAEVAHQGPKSLSKRLSGLFSSPSVPPPPPLRSKGPQAPTWGAQAPAAPSSQSGAFAPSDSQTSIPATPTQWASQKTASGTGPPILQRGPSGLPLSTVNRPLPIPPLPADAPQKQDTGSMQKVRMARATMILTGSFIVGRILGLLRNSLFIFVLGAGTASDAYLQAFLIPDLIFNIVAGGALSSAFIPVFTHYMLGEKDEKSAWHITSSALNLALSIMCALAFIAIIFAPHLVPLYNPGVPPAEMSLIISLTHIMLLQSIIMGAGVIVNSVLYSRQQFLLPAIGTVLYNVGLIVGLLPGFFLVFFGRSQAHLNIAVYAATIGVVLGAVLQVGVQIPGLLKERMRYHFVFDWKHPGVRQIGRQMLPRVLNAAMLYFSTFVDRGLILLLIVSPLLANQQGLITQYYQALQLVLLPLGIFGMAVSTAAFPTLAENVTLGRLDRVRTIIEDTLRSILFLSIPASVGLIVLGLPIIQVLLQHGPFSLADATTTSVPLAFFAFGLAGLAAVEILTRSFYAFRDSRTPVIVSVAQFILKIFLSLILLALVKGDPSWRLGMLAFSTSVAGLLEAAVLLWLLQRKLGMLRLRQLAIFSGRVLLAALAMGIGVLLLRTLLDTV